jgi:rubrerythrin
VFLARVASYGDCVNARQDGDLHLPLLENALDFLASAVEHLQLATSRSLKYAVLHLGAGVELLIKERLRQEDWQLLFDDVSAADELKYAAGDFYGVTPPEALKRLRDIGVELPRRQKQTLTLLRQKRNRIQHFAVVDTKASFEVVTARALGFALDFIANEIESAAGDAVAADYIETLREAVGELDAFVRERWSEIRDAVETEKVNTAVIVCARCGEEAAAIDDGARCLFCGYATGAEDTAHQYASEVLGITLYETVTDGGEYPVSHCPSCEYETLVDRGGGEQPRWFCATCGRTWEDGQLDNCLICGRLYSGEMSVCDDCFEERLRTD